MFPLCLFVSLWSNPVPVRLRIRVHQCSLAALRACRSGSVVHKNSFPHSLSPSEVSAFSAVEIERRFFIAATFVLS